MICLLNYIRVKLYEGQVITSQVAQGLLNSCRVTCEHGIVLTFSVQLTHNQHCCEWFILSYMKKIVLATGNQGKVRELQALLQKHLGSDYKVLPQSDFDVGNVPETGTTFVENAIIKARHASRISGLPAVADDSGLVVDALNGEPGIYSARYAGIDGDQNRAAADSANNAKLMHAMQDVPAELRTARFVCVLVMMRHVDDPLPIICQGVWNGEIGLAAKGENGFGYDPLFVVPEHGCMSAELSPEQKQQLSHRGQALKQLIQKIAG